MSCLLSGKKALTMFKVIQLNKTVLDVKEWLIIRVGGVIEAELDFCTVQSLYCPFAKNNLPNVPKKRTRKCIKKKKKTWHTCILFIFYRYLKMPTQVLHQYKKRKKHRCEHARWVQKKKQKHQIHDFKSHLRNLKTSQECFQHYWQSHGQRWSDLCRSGWCWFTVKRY